MAGSKLVQFEFDPFELAGINKSDVPLTKRNNVLLEVKDFVLESVLSKVGSQRSPVAGHGKFKKLSKDYAAQKKAEHGNKKANLEAEGDLLDSVRVFKSGRGRLKLTVLKAQEAKADGHNNHSGDSELPLRRFIPEDNETFSRDIIKGMRDIIKRGTGDN